MTNLLCSSSAQLVTSPALRQSSCRGFCGVTDNDAFVGDSCQCVQSVPGSSSGWQGEGRKQHFHLVPDPLHIQDFIFICSVMFWFGGLCVCCVRIWLYPDGGYHCCFLVSSPTQQALATSKPRIFHISETLVQSALEMGVYDWVTTLLLSLLIPACGIFPPLFIFSL